MRPKLVALLAVAVGCVGALPTACRCRPENVVDGVLDAPTPLKTPLGGHDACAVRVNLKYVTNPGTSGANSRIHNERSDTRYPAGATFVVDGKRLLVVGTGGYPSVFELHDGGRWPTGDSPPPAGLRGWGREHDRLLDLATSGQKSTTTYGIAFTEEYLPCGEEVGLEGVVYGDRFVLRPEKLRPREKAGP